MLSEKYPMTTHLHGYSFQKDNLGVFGAGTVEWYNESPEESDIFQLLQRSHNKIKNSKKKIMVTHMHPSGSKSEIIGFEGSKAIRKAIDKFHPDILISAHIHETGGLKEKIGRTTVINVSRHPEIFEI
jgi:Icc-related predicted phosphoesterase